MHVVIRFLAIGGFCNQLLCDADRIGRREPQTVRDAPEPDASRDAWVRLDSRKLNLAFARHAHVTGRRIARLADAYAERCESIFQLFGRHRRFEFSKRSISIPVKYGSLHQLNRGSGRATGKIARDISGYLRANILKAELAFLAIAGQQVEGHLRVESRWTNFAKREDIARL